MSRAAQRRRKVAKALGGVSMASCTAPDKVRYAKLWMARQAAARRVDVALTPYACGNHYHLTSHR